MVKLRSWVVLATTGCFLSLFGRGAEDSASTVKSNKAPPEKAEEAGWEPVFTDNFDRKELGENWKVVSGKWEIKDGNLHGSGTLLCTKNFPARDETGQIYPGGFALGYIRMEFEATSAVKPFIFFKDQKPEVVLGDLSCFMNARSSEESKDPLYTSGYFFQFGGLYNTRNEITKKGQSVVSDLSPSKVIETNKRHKIIAENDQGHLRFFVDGEPLLDYEESGSIMGSGFDQIGFYFYTAFDVHTVNVYVKKLPGGLDRD